MFFILSLISKMVLCHCLLDSYRLDLAKKQIKMNNAMSIKNFLISVTKEI